MTTISVPGKITAIEVSGTPSATPLSGGLSTAPTAIMPSGADITIVLASGSGSSLWFKMDASFNVGDIVEIYAADMNGFHVMDENGVGIGAGGSFIGQGCTLRKIASGTGSPNWGSNV